MQNNITDTQNSHLSQNAGELQKFVNELIDKFSEMTATELAANMDELKKICLEFDPYQPHLIPEDIEASLKKFRLDEMLGNPFTFTNNLLRILTTVETEFKLRAN